MKSKSLSDASLLIPVISTTALGLVVGLGIVVVVARPDVAQSVLDSIKNGDNSAVEVVSETQPAEPDPEFDDFFDEEFEPMSDEDLAAWLDDIAGHPDDPSMPFGVLGSSDDVIQSYSPLEVKEILEDREVIDFINRDEAHRFKFAMGRLAMFHGYTTYAERMLRAAAAEGSGGAQAYLADPAFTVDDEVAARMLERSSELGFRPADFALAELRSSGSGFTPGIVEDLPPDQPSRSFSYDDFDFPNIVQAFSEGRQPSGVSALQLGTYLSSFLRAVSDQQNLFLVLNPREFLIELDPTLALEAEAALASSPAAMNEAMEIGWEQMGKMLTGIGRLHQGQNMANGIAQMNNDLMHHQIGLGNYRLGGEHDGKRLVIMFDDHPDEFRKIYNGIKKVLRGG